MSVFPGLASRLANLKSYKLNSRLVNPGSASVLLLPSVSTSINLASGNFVTPTSNIATDTTTLGPGIIVSNQTSVIENIDLGPSDPLFDTKFCTIIYASVRKRPDITAGVIHGYGVYTPDDRVLITEPYSDGVLYWDYGNATSGAGGGSLGFNINSATYLAENTINIYGFTAGIRGREIWRNGRRLAAAATSTFNRPSSAQNFYFNSYELIGDQNAESVSLFFVSKQELPAEVMQALTENPWLLFDESNAKIQVIDFPVAAAGGPLQTLTQSSTFANAQAFNAHTLTARITVTQSSTFANSQAFNAHAVTTGPVTVTQSSIFANSQAFNAHALNTRITVDQTSRFNNAQAFNAHTISTSYTLTQASRFANAQAFNAHTVTTGAVTITQTATFGNAQAFNAHTITKANEPQTVTQSSIFGNAQAFNAHTIAPGAVTVTQSSRFDNAQAFNAHTISTSYTLTQASRFANAQAFNAHTVTTGAVTITQTATFGNAQAFNAHAITQAGLQTLTQTAIFGNEQYFYQHSIPSATGEAFSGGFVDYGSQRERARLRPQLPAIEPARKVKKKRLQEQQRIVEQKIDIAFDAIEQWQKSVETFAKQSEQIRLESEAKQAADEAVRRVFEQAKQAAKDKELKRQQDAAKKQAEEIQALIMQVELMQQEEEESAILQLMLEL